jgi:hypothetical protein
MDQVSQIEIVHTLPINKYFIFWSRMARQQHVVGKLVHYDLLNGWLVAQQWLFLSGWQVPDKFERQVDMRFGRIELFDDKDAWTKACVGIVDGARQKLESL